MGRTCKVLLYYKTVKCKIAVGCSSNGKMTRGFSSTLATACALLLLLQLVSSEPKLQLDHDTVDAFKTLENFPYAIALYDIDRDGDLDCLNAVRTEFEKEPPSATYILSIKDQNGQTMKNFTYYLQPGPTPDSNVVVIDNDYDHPLKNRFVYSDYEKCVIMQFPMNNRQVCVLWVNSAIKDDVPQSCVDQYQDNCSEGTPSYDQDSFVSFHIALQVSLS
uniref:Putative lipocalin-2 1 n=1 Tax=Amblyomma triste TaxID=251400 RepID=A0A023G5I2_AMBTT